MARVFVPYRYRVKFCVICLHRFEMVVARQMIPCWWGTAGANIAAASTVHLSACLPCRPPCHLPCCSPCPSAVLALFVYLSHGPCAVQLHHLHAHITFQCSLMIIIYYTHQLHSVYRVDLQHTPTIGDCLHHQHRTYREEWPL